MSTGCNYQRTVEETSLADEDSMRSASSGGGERGVAALGTAGGFAALLSAAACCVLPLAFAAAGLATGGLAFLVPYHWPLTIVAALAVAVGWFLYFRKQRACARDASCSVAAPSAATRSLLILATAFVLLSAVWKLWFEQPLMRLFSGG
jgi:mercuric ion transport protein